MMKSHRETLDLSIDSNSMASFLFPGRQLCSVNELRDALDSCKGGKGGDGASNKNNDEINEHRVHLKKDGSTLQDPAL